MNLFIDESIHVDYGFMVIAYVLCEENPQDELNVILEKYCVPEFHACAKMENNDLMQNLRAEFVSFVNSRCNWGILILPKSNRPNLQHDIEFMLGCLVKDVCKSPTDIFIDEGMINVSQTQSMRSIKNINSVTIGSSCVYKGIQLADLVAAFNGIRLKERISNKPKMLTYGESYGYTPPIEAELGQFELWATLRYSILHQSTPMGDNMPEMAMFPTIGYGLLISPNCSPELAKKAEEEFGVVYLGCIH